MSARPSSRRPDQQLDMLELEPAVRDLANECELTGRRTIFARNGRPVAILTAYDEYQALRETLAIVNDPVLRARLEAAEGEVQRNALLLPEDLSES